MQVSGKPISLVDAITDVKERSLSSVAEGMQRLVYLASTRNYITGQYSHDGLAYRFREDLADMALAYCHYEAFQAVLGTSLKEFTREVESIVCPSNAARPETLKSWKRLQQYRMLVPKDPDPVECTYFFSNFRLALAVLEARLEEQGREQSASQLP